LPRTGADAALPTRRLISATDFASQEVDGAITVAMSEKALHSVPVTCPIASIVRNVMQCECDGGIRTRSMAPAGPERAVEEGAVERFFQHRTVQRRRAGAAPVRDLPQGDKRLSIPLGRNSLCRHPPTVGNGRRKGRNAQSVSQKGVSHYLIFEKRSELKFRGLGMPRAIGGRRFALDDMKINATQRPEVRLVRHATADT
jgi:hypothetical protein